MKHLVVNADDLGADRGRNRGILEGVRSGVVTSVSVLVNGPAFEDCVGELLELPSAEVSVGLHLNLSEGAPLAGSLSQLARNGNFPGKWVAHRRLEDSADRDLRREVEEEIDAQFRALEAVGLTPDHLDGHQHIHLWPAVLPLALDAARRFGVGWVRVPDQPVPPPDADFLQPPGGEEFAARGAWARPLVEASGVRCPDRFRGLDLVNRLDSASLQRLARELPEGVTELMVHPGRAGPAEGPFSGFSTERRDAELVTLLAPRFRRALAGVGAVLGPFPRVSP